MGRISHRQVIRIDADGLHLDLGDDMRGLVPTAEVFAETSELIRLGHIIYQGKLCIAVGDYIPVIPIASKGRSYSRREAVIQAADQATASDAPSTVSARILEIAFDDISCLTESGYEIVLDRRLTEEAIATDPRIERRLSPEKIPERSWLYPGDHLYARPLKLISPGKVEGELVLHGQPVARGEAGSGAAVTGPPAAPASRYEEILVVDDDPSTYDDPIRRYFARGGYKVSLVSNLSELGRWLDEYLARQRARELKPPPQQDEATPPAGGLLALVRLDADPRAFRWDEMCRRLVAGTSSTDVILLCHGHIDFARRLRKTINDNRDAFHVRNVWSLTFGLQGLGALIAGRSAIDQGDEQRQVQMDDGEYQAVPSLYRYRSFKADCIAALSSLLQTAEDRTRPHAAILFNIHRQSHEVAIECATGDLKLTDAFARITYHLHLSPIRDLAIYGRNADIDDASKEPGRYLYFLLPAGGEGTTLSVMGRRLLSPPGSAYAHVAFLFSRRSKAFSDNSGLSKAFTSACNAMQTALMARALDGRIEDISETAELAFDFRHMSHEAVALMRESQQLLENTVQPLEVAQLRGNTQRAMVLLRRVLEAELKCDYESFCPTTVARGILKRSENIGRKLREEDGLPPDGILADVVVGDGLGESIVAPRTVFECVLRNLTLNSFFQILQCCGGYGKIEVRIDLVHDEDDGQGRLVVSVVDDGPGIHGRYWEDVFVTGVSTREKGTGFGLPLSRRLLREVCGELSLVNSHVYGGSEFRFTVPVHEPMASEEE